MTTLGHNELIASVNTKHLHLHAHQQGWGQLHNINSTPTPTPEVSTPTPTPANLQNINSNSGSFNSNSNSGKSPEYQLQLRRFQLQLQFQLRRFQLQFQLQLWSFKSNPNSISNPINLVQLKYHYPITMWNIVWIKWRYAVDICHVAPNLGSNRSTLAQPMIKSSHGFLNTLLSEQNGPDFADNIFKYLFWIKMFVFSIKFHWSLIVGIQLAISQHWYS